MAAVRILCAVLSLVLLNGCTGTLVRLVQQGDYLHQAADEYVRDVHDMRRWIRQECRASLQRQINELRKGEDEQGLRAVLARNYPPLVTFDVLADARDDPTGILSKPPCR